MTLYGALLLTLGLWGSGDPEAAHMGLLESGEQRVAQLGECALEGGAVIRDCRVGYRVLGALNAQRSNVVLVPTWFGGTSEHLLNFLGRDGLLNPEEWYIIVVDALGNGVSSSPSNSPEQADGAFPAYTVGDMVATQHRLLTEVLGIHRLHAVVGVSMGGMQALQWSVTHPDFLDHAVSVVGTPWLTTWDRLYWGGMARVLDECLRRGCDNPGGLFNLLASLGVYTPEERERRTPRSEVDAFLSALEAQGSALRPWDTLSQIRAMQPLDITAPFGRSLLATSRAIRARILVVVATRDLTVRPGPSLELARAVGGREVISQSGCGHQVFVCETREVGRHIGGFLRGGAFLGSP